MKRASENTAVKKECLASEFLVLTRTQTDSVTMNGLLKKRFGLS